MAKVTYGPPISEARGKAGDNVFTHTRGGNVARALSLEAGGVGPHNLLGTSHPDTIPATPPTRGDLITGQAATPLWQRLPKGTPGQVLACDADDALWTTPKDGMIFAQTELIELLGDQASGTLLAPNTGSKTIPANTLAVGSTYLTHLSGYYLKSPDGNDYLQLQLFLNAITLYGTQQNYEYPPAGYPHPWWIEFVSICHTIGSTETIATTARGKFQITPTTAWFPEDYPTHIEIDTTIDQVFDVKAFWYYHNQVAGKIATATATIQRLAL